VISRFTARRARQDPLSGLAPESTHAGVTEPLLHPRYWLFFGLPWPGGPGPAQATVAIAPPTIPRAGLSGDAREILAVADAYAKCTPVKVVFLSDLMVGPSRQ